MLSLLSASLFDVCEILNEKLGRRPFLYRWGVEQLPNRLPSVGAHFCSPVFEAAPGVLMYVELGRNVVDDEEWLSAHLRLSPKSPVKRATLSGCSIGLLRSSPPKQDHNRRVFTVDQMNFDVTTGDNRGWRKFVRFPELINPEEGFLKDGHLLTFFVKGSVFYEAFDEKEYFALLKSKSIAELETPIDKKPSEKYRKLLDEGLHADFAVKANDSNGVEKELKVHKAILAVGSEVFAAMLSPSAESKESLERKLKIEDIGFEAIEALLRFLYTGKLTPADVKGQELDLLIAADKYQLDGLKKLIEQSTGKRGNVGVGGKSSFWSSFFPGIFRR